MVLLQAGLLKVFLLSCQMCDHWFNPCLPFKWNKVKQQFVLKPMARQNFTRFRLNTSSIYLFFTLMQIVWLWNDCHSTLIILSIMITSGYIMCLSAASHLACNNTPLLVSLLNDMIAFERNHYKNPTKTEIAEVSKEAAWSKMIIQVQSLSAYLPISYHLGLLVQPCYPMVVGSWILGECNGPAGQFIVAKLTVDGLSFFVFSFLLPQLVIQLVMMVLQGFCFRTYIARCSRYTKIIYHYIK